MRKRMNVERSFDLLCICILLSMMFLGLPVRVQAEDVVVDLGGGIHVIGGKYNVTVAEGERGLLVIDTRPKQFFSTVSAEIEKLSDKPILYVVNTHYHYDHVDANAEFRALGAEIVSHSNMPQRMIVPPVHPLTGEAVAPSLADALPTITYQDHATLALGGVIAELIHPQPAHTDGDTIILFRRQNVLISGDIIGSTYPNIDVAVGGGIDGIISAVDMILSMVDDQTQVVPGHNKILPKAGVVEYREMLQTARDRIAKAKGNGMTEQEVAAANLLTDLDETWLIDHPIVKLFPRNVYRSLP